MGGSIKVDFKNFDCEVSVRMPKSDSHRDMIGPLKWRLLLAETSIRAQLMLMDKASPAEWRSVGECEFPMNRPNHIGTRRSSVSSDLSE